MGFRQDFASGMQDMAPLLPAGAIVGAVTGIAATTTGLPPIQAISMSIIVYYPSVMLTAFVLLEAGTPVAILVVTSLVVGSRSIMYSLSLAPHFTRFSTAWKWFLAYFLWTPVYAFSIEQYESIEFPPVVKQSLGYLPPAILAALISSQLFVANGSLATMVVNEEVIAGGMAAIVAWRTQSMMATIGVGMGVLWVVTFLIG